MFEKKLRIVMLNWRDPENPLAGGAERVTLGYLADLAERGHEVFWLTHSYEGCEKTTEISGVRVIRLGNLIRSRIRAYIWVKNHFPIDLLIDQHHGIPWFTNLWAPCPAISYIHEVLGPIWKSFYPFPLAQLGIMQERITLWFYRKQKFWTGCHTTQIHLKDAGVRDVTIIPYGVDLKPLKTLPTKILEPPLRLAMVSRLAPNKRVHLGVALLKSLNEQGVDTYLKIIGTGECESEIRRVISDNGMQDRCELLGHVEEGEKLAHLQEAHFLVHTSMREGWGLNVVEANAYGTPAVVFPVPGLIDSTTHLETGYISKYEDVASLALVILEAIQNPKVYQECRKNALMRARSHLWEEVLPHARSFVLTSAQS